MKKFFGLYSKIPLILKIAIGIVIGIVLGLFVKNVSLISMLGDIFVGALKSVAPILVFVLVIL